MLPCGQTMTDVPTPLSFCLDRLQPIHHGGAPVVYRLMAIVVYNSILKISVMRYREEKP